MGIVQETIQQRVRHRRVVDGFMMPPFEIALFVLLAERIRIVP